MNKFLNLLPKINLLLVCIMLCLWLAQLFVVNNLAVKNEQISQLETVKSSLEQEIAVYHQQLWQQNSLSFLTQQIDQTKLQPARSAETVYLSLPLAWVQP